MVPERLVVIGGVAAGLSAASRARRVSPQLEILVYENGPDISYSACGLPYLVAGMVREMDPLRVYSPEFFQRQRNIQVYTSQEVTEISTPRRRVTVVARGSGKPQEVPYDRLVIATGAEPARPSVPGLDLRGVCHVNDLQSTPALRRYLEVERPLPAVIVGGGYIGLEMAEALKALGLSVTLLERSHGLFEAFDEDLAASIERELTAQKVQVIKGAEVTALLGDRDGRIRKVVCGEGPGMDADCAVLATGVRARVQLAAPVWDPVLIAAQEMLRELRR